MKILVSGLINLETTLKIDGFPISYQPVRYPFFGIQSTVSGVGYNVVKALTTLGDDVRFLSLIGDDQAGQVTRTALSEIGVSDRYVRSQLAETAQSVILYDPEGSRMINTDLKDNQEQVYPPEIAQKSLSDCALAILCNVNFSRPMLKMAKDAGVPIATDVHTIGDLYDDYNADFMRAADVLFMSDEHLPDSPETWARKIQQTYGTPIIVIGLGRQGALLAIKGDNFIERIPAVHTRDVVNTIGAGDALFTSFNHYYAKLRSPYEAIRRAMVFASFKIGARGAADGFLSEAGVETWFQRVADSP